MLNIALVADELTTASLEAEVNIYNLTPETGISVLRNERPDFLLVESAWKGWQSTWAGKIAHYPKNPFRNNWKLRRLVREAKSLGIPAVFWNKEDDVHFDRFIRSARHFDHIYTVDSNAVQKYKKVCGESKSVHILPFAVQPSLHNFTGFNFKYHHSAFVGSYSMHIHPNRRVWQNMLFKAACDNGGLTVFDRNYDRSSNNYRYPKFTNLKVKQGVPYRHTAQIYKDFLISLNVNTIEYSPTMFSRRLIEIMACGGMAVTSPSVSVETLFQDTCFVVRDQKEASVLLERLFRNGPTDADFERMRAGVELVQNNYTWDKRLQEIAKRLGL